MEDEIGPRILGGPPLLAPLDTCDKKALRSRSLLILPGKAVRRSARSLLSLLVAATGIQLDCQRVSNCLIEPTAAIWSVAAWNSVETRNFSGQVANLARVFKVQPLST